MNFYQKIEYDKFVKLVINDASVIIYQKLSVIKSNNLYSDYEITYVYPINNEYIGIVVKKGE